MPIGVYERGLSFEQRFWGYVNKTDSCWLWIGNKIKGGYGRIALSRGKHLLAHRVSYQMLIGEIPIGLELDHICRVTSCVNPEHLEPVVHRENVIRGLSPSAENSSKTHCKHGHLLSEGYSYSFKGKNMRQCKTCTLLRTKRYRKNHIVPEA